MLVDFSGSRPNIIYKAASFRCGMSIKIGLNLNNHSWMLCKDGSISVKQTNKNSPKNVCVCIGLPHPRET